VTLFESKAEFKTTNFLHRANLLAGVLNLAIGRVGAGKVAALGIVSKCEKKTGGIDRVRKILRVPDRPEPNNTVRSAGKEGNEEGWGRNTKLVTLAPGGASQFITTGPPVAEGYGGKGQADRSNDCDMSDLY